MSTSIWSSEVIRHSEATPAIASVFHTPGRSPNGYMEAKKAVSITSADQRLRVFGCQNGTMISLIMQQFETRRHASRCSIMFYMPLNYEILVRLRWSHSSLNCPLLHAEFVQRSLVAKLFA